MFHILIQRGKIEGMNEGFQITKELIDLSTDSIFIMQNGIIQYVNPVLLQVSGYNLSELIGIEFTEFIPSHELDKVYSLFTKRENGENTPTKYESRAKLRNGKFIDVEVSVVHVLFEDKPAFQVVLRDITKHKIAERKYQNIIDFAPIGFYQSSRNGDFLLVNDEMANILGFEHKEELISKNISEFYYTIEEREKLIGKYDTTTKSEVKNVEIKFRKKDGSPIWILMTAKAIKDEGLNTISYDGFIIDISDRKRKENVQALLLNLSKKSFTNISLKEYLKLIHTELKQIIQANNFYVALYDKTTNKYSFPYSNDPYDGSDYDSPVYLDYSLTNMVREEKQGRLVDRKSLNELVKKHRIKIYGKVSSVWLGVPLIDSSNDEAIGVLALQDYDNEKAYDKEDFNTLKIIAGNVGLFIERIINQEKLKLAKAEAEEGEKRYKSLFYDNNSVMILVDPKTGSIVDANKSACTFYGYTYREITALKMQQIDIMPKKEMEAEIQKKGLADSGGQFFFRHRLASGEIKEVELYTGNVNIAGKDLLYSIVHDVTERRIAEEMVLKLSTSIEQSPISVIITNLKGVIEYANPYYSEISGYNRGELVGEKPSILKSGIHNITFYKELWDTILAGDKWQGEMCNKKKNGELYWEHARISPIVNIKGEITHFVGIKEDITEKRETEKKLKFLADSLEQVGECVTITDHHDIILYVNNAFSLTYGYSKNEVIGKHMKMFQPDDVAPSQIEELFSETKKGNWNGELINKRKDNSLFPVLLSTSVINDDKNNQIAFIGVARDITELKKQTDELISSKEKAQESDRLKSAFLANMSHEIRTPMNGILGFSNLLLEPELSDETKDAYIKIIHQSGKRMLNTVTDIVEISKIEAGIIDVRNSKFNLSESVISMLNFFQPEAQKKGLILGLESELQETNLFINTDKNKFESIFTNLIKNAIKYTDTGKIIVRTFIKTGFVEFCIEDTGIGVPKNRKEAIFNRFEQADIEDTRVFQGSGLGLAISKSYVEMLGGKIWVESIEGEGSQFYFSIPCCTFEKESSITYNIESTNKELNFRGNYKILIVEDDDASTIFLETILKGIAQKIVHAKTGEQAIEICKKNSDFDVILMDIKMPGIDGFETTKRIREINSAVIIIAQTAYALSGDKEKAISSGCNDYITKPVKKELLLFKIEKNIKEST